MPGHEGVLLCPDCFGDKGLKYRITLIRPQFNDANCTFHPTKKGIPVEDVAKIVDEVFRDNYGGSQPNGYGTETGNTLDEILYELTEATEDGAAEALKAQLIESDNYWPKDGEEAYYDDEYDYHRLEITDSYGTLWSDFHRHLKHEQRFFSTKAFNLVHEIFDGVT
jgi:hypothetical protein